MARKNKKPRTDTSAEAEPLTDNPFAALDGFTGLPEGQAPARGENSGGPADAPAPSAAAFQVRRTRKGGFPIRVERRSGGKWVTIVEGVSGDAAALAARLKKHCGAGGAVRDGAVEIQGDHREAIGRFLQARL